MLAIGIVAESCTVTSKNQGERMNTIQYLASLSISLEVGTELEGLSQLYE